MDYVKCLTMLEKDIGAAVVSTLDSDQQPHARFINMGVGNEEGVFFMTAPVTEFYQQLQANPKIAITGMKKQDNEIEVIRLEGEVREVGPEFLAEILKDNPYVKDVYPDEKDQQSVRAFQVFKGKGSYQHLQKKIKEPFEFNVE